MSGDGKKTTTWDRVRQNFMEQPCHALWGAAPVATVLFLAPHRPVLAGALAGLMVALPRELIDQWPIQRPWDTVLDLASFAAGGAAMGLVWGLAWGLI